MRSNARWLLRPCGLPFLSFQFVLACLDSLHRLCRGDDRDVPVVLEGEQVVITRDDEIGLSCDGHCQHRIIIRIAAHRLWQGWRFDYFRQPVQLVECAATRCVGTYEDGVELRAANYVGQLGQERRAADKCELPASYLVQQLMRRATP